MAPANHPQAQFVPISPDFDLNALVDKTHNFDYVTRLSTEKLKEHSIQSFEALVLAVVIQSGKPLVIEDWGESLPPWLYSPDWIQENLGNKPEQVRDIPNEVNIPMTIGHYLRSMETLTNRITPATYRDPKRQRLYLKDIDTPEAWANHLKEVIPESVFYLNECIEPRTGGDGAIREPNEYGQMVYGKGVAPAGDLMSSLPPEMRAMNMMCYIGHEGTYTPAHREMCASLGHNIMVEASENKRGEKAGSSIWFMTETKEREVVSEYFLSMLGHDIEVEKHFAQVNAWKKAPFNVWVVEQKVGDLILIPPLAPHQVWNRGTRTMKAAWNRTTVDTLELALHEALPRARMVCREEQYKNKAIVYYTLLKYYALLQRDTVEEKMWKYGRIKQVLEDFKRLFALFTEILVSEMFSPKLPEEEDVEYIEYDSNITCSYCRGNIFNRFLTCKSCIQVGPGGEEDTYDICMDCYAMGRSCACISNLTWVEQWSWTTLVDNYDHWKEMVEKVLESEGSNDRALAPKSLEIARKRYGRKPVAEVCQEQLRIRPWTDITKEVQREPSPMSEEEPDVDDEGRIIKKKRKGQGRSGGSKRFAAVKNKTHACHICCYHDWNWKLAFCSTCNKSYCYGTLWRAFDLMPQTVMEDKEWSCPCCLKICSCGKCRKDPRQKPYSPKGTLLGHDTKKVADFRSVESLVNFSKTNLAWLRGEDDNDPQQSSRMKKLKEKAEVEKARVEEVDDSYMEGMEHTAFGADNGEASAQASGNQDIDPFLIGNGDASASHGQYNGHYENGQFDSMDDTAHGEVNHATPGGGPSLNVDWMGNDGQYDFDDLDPSSSHNQGENQNLDQNQNGNQNQASYPSRLVPEQTYPDPTHVGQDRMMGAGFYKQGTGADRILFDAPEEIDVDVEVYQPNPMQNPNFALSDLLDPVLNPESTKKKRRMGVDGAEDEEEFFTSKRQKLIAKAKQMRQKNGDDTEADLNIQPAHRQPRRSMGKTSYTDLGEDAVPIEEDEGPSTVRTRDNEQRKRKLPKEPLTDMELAAQALNRLTNPGSAATPIKRRGRTRNVGEPSSYSPATNTIKTPRRSAWLARKEAADSDGVSVHDNTPSELPKRGRGRPRSALQTSTTIDISSASEDSDEGGVVLHDDDDNDDDDVNDSLFGEPIGREEEEILDVVGNNDGVSSAFTETLPSNALDVDFVDPIPVASGIEIRALGKTGPVNVANLVQAEKPTPKRRGRPPKNPRPVESESVSPAPVTIAAAPVTKLLSLKEKLALKGKSFKIVAKPVASSSGPPSTGNTPSVLLKSILKTTTASASPAWNKFDEQSVSASPGLGPVWSKFDDNNVESTSPTISSSSRPVQPAVGAPALEVRKGPTVVRLLSPSTEGDDASSRSRSRSVSSDGESGSDTSIPAVRLPANQARRGGTAVRGRGRPRGRPSLGRVV